MTYVASDRTRIAEGIQEQFATEGMAVRRDDRRPRDRTDFYTAIHLHVSLPEDLPGLDLWEGIVCEIQVTSMMAHIWAEMEHDIQYKRPAGIRELTAAEGASLQALGGLVETGDYLIEVLLKSHAEAADEDANGDTEDESRGATVPAVLHAAFPGARTYELADPLAVALKEMDIGDPGGLRDSVLGGADCEDRAREVEALESIGDDELTSVNVEANSKTGEFCDLVALKALFVSPTAFFRLRLQGPSSSGR